MPRHARLVSSLVIQSNIPRAEARKTSSKLRTHLEDIRQEQQRQQSQCRDHTTDLEKHRAHLAKLFEEEQQSRASLQAANAQVATLRAQLDRAVEQKVQRRLLKCFWTGGPGDAAIMARRDDLTRYGWVQSRASCAGSALGIKGNGLS